MSLSRAIALATNDCELEKIFTDLAREAVKAGGGRDMFDKILRPHLNNLHKGGMAQDRLKCLRREARKVFFSVQRATPGQLPAEMVRKYGRQQIGVRILGRKV
jgi:hypothetical protein